MKFKKLLCGAFAMLFIAACFNLSAFSATLRPPNAPPPPPPKLSKEISGYEYIDKLIKIAREEKATFKKAADGSTKYAKGNGSWCAHFVSWCAKEAGITETIIAKQSNADGSWYAKNATLTYFFKTWLSTTGQKNIEKYGKFSNRTDYKPEKGDLIYFKWSNANKDTTFSHVGLVLSSDDKYVYTIEGNSDKGTIKENFYSKDNKTIVAYAKPKYSSIEPLINTYKTGTYFVYDSGLNLHTGPETSFKKLKTKIEIYSKIVITKINGIWGQTKYNGVSGWVNMELLTNYPEYV